MTTVVADIGETTTLLPGAMMWHAELCGGGILKVRIDRRDKSVNALSKSMLEELERLIAEIRRDTGVRRDVSQRQAGKLHRRGRRDRDENDDRRS